jgi:hypothetical protein
MHAVGTSTSSRSLLRIDFPEIRLSREYFDYETVGKVWSFQHNKINFYILYSDIIFPSYLLSQQLTPHRRIFRGTPDIECPSTLVLFGRRFYKLVL